MTKKNKTKNTKYVATYKIYAQKYAKYKILNKNKNICKIQIQNTEQK